MKAYPSGWQAGLQGLSDTLGGTAEFQRDTQTIRDRQGLAQRELDQRMLEEQRRQKMLDLEVQHAQRKIAAEDAQRAFQFDEAQRMLEEERDTLFQQIRGEEPTIQQAKEMRNLERLTQSLSPENAGLVIEQHGAQRKSKASAQGLRKWTQELNRPIQEGTLQDPGDQQQLQLYAQGGMQVADMVEQGLLRPQDAVDYIEQTNAKVQDLQLKAGARQQKLEMKQRVIGEIDTRMQGLRPGDPRAQKLGQMKPLVLSDMMDPDDVGKVLIAEDLGIPEERMAEFLETVKEMQAGRTRQAVTDPYSAVAGTMQDIGMQFPQANGQAAQAAAVEPNREAFLQDVQRLRSPTPEAVKRLMRKHGLENLSQQEAEALFGG